MARRVTNQNKVRGLQQTKLAIGSGWTELGAVSGAESEYTRADTSNIAEELNEEDQQLKSELEMLVERLQVSRKGEMVVKALVC